MSWTASPLNPRPLASIHSDIPSMSSKKANNSKSKSNANKTDKRAQSLAQDNRNGSLRSADYDELSTGDELKPEPLDPEKYETFRRIASAEESEELDTFYNASSDDGYDLTHETGNDLSGMDPIRREQLQEEWRLELAKTEEEIQTLRQVLTSKVQRAHELKRKLGITVWKEFREDMEQGIKNIQETTAYKETSDKIVEWNTVIQSAPISGLGIFSAPAYQKTSDAVKTATEKTSSVFGSLGGSVARKLGEVKNSNAFKSFEERVGSAVTNVKTSDAVKTATEKTSSVFGSLGGSVARKLGEVKNSNAFKSFEERVGSAVTNVKSKMSTSRSNSTNSFEDALNSTERKSSLNATSPITSPTIPEDRPIS
ncbi:unnamed protein product [Oppiella nova]|uniref:Tumor protein D54 n=1 Tax=Oppiella nova TaxID=334625 RepID=A0A7R9LSI5_9ACAR|nr:unnamed protein product [Oppiella nova]CAG2165788.1 unnamed protein product [Oppiella nova]